MEILKKNNENSLLISQENSFLNNLGWDENALQFDDEVLKQIINPIDNYETVRFIHSPYSGLTDSNKDNESDIWYKFYFIDSNQTYVNGLDYNLVGITPRENYKLLKQTTNSFFKLEFFKTPNDEPPTRINRKLVFSKNLPLTLGEKYHYTTINKDIFIPVFMGSNYRNKENMFVFWFQDDSLLSGNTLSGNTFYLTAKFFNADNGSIYDFTNSGLTISDEIVEERDMYYKMVIDRSDYTYQIFEYNLTTGQRIGNGITNPIKFYEKRT